eukprot:PITA_13782
MKNDTWELIEFPKDKVPIGCKWLFNPKFNVDGSIDKYKAILVAKGYSQKDGIDYEDTFAHVAKLNTIRIMIGLATKQNWKMHLLDVKSAFLNGELKEEVYLVQPKGLVKQGQEHLVCRLKKDFKSDPNLYIKRDEDGNIALISLYVDDLIITGSALRLIEEIKIQLAQVFEMKDIGESHYCLGLEIGRESGFSHSGWAGNPDDRRSTSGYAFNLGSGVASRNSKKQPIVSLSSMEAEYKALTNATCEAIWLKRIIEDVGEKQRGPTSIKCDNQSSMTLANNPIYHARINHIEVQHHFVRETIQSNEIHLVYCNTSENVADIFT